MTSFATPDRVWRVDIISLNGQETYRVLRNGLLPNGYRSGYHATIGGIASEGCPVAQLQEISSCRSDSD